jgi:hypothetical protein
MAVILFAATRKPLSNQDEPARDRHPQYFFMSIGMTVGIAAGILVGLAAGSVSGGIAVGIGFGLILGQSLEKRNKGTVGPLPEQEEQERLKRAGLGLVAVCILVLATLVCTVLQMTR